MIGRSGERGSGISVLAARHDDDEILNGRKSLKSTFENDFEQSLNVFCLHFLFVFFSSIIGYLKVKRIKV